MGSGRTNITGALSFVLVLAVIAPGRTEVIHVPADHATITEAVEAAIEDDTIVVAPGYYSEPNLYINKDLELTSETGEADCATIYGNGGVSIHVEDCRLTLKGFTIYGYTDANLHLDWSNAILENLIVTGAGQVERGMGILSYSNWGLWSNLTIVGNRPSLGGDAGGAFIYYDNHIPEGPIMKDCIIAFNEGYGIDISSDSWFWDYFFSGYPALYSSCIYGNDLGAFAPDNLDLTNLFGNISKDPQFVDWENGDFELMPHSPCLPEGNYTRSLMGALGMTDPTDVDEAPSNAPPLLLLQNHPNPFNPSTRIEFVLGEPQLVSAEVFDASGRRVATLSKERSFAAGHHHLTWNGRNESGRAMASGIYFVQIKTPLESQRRKMLLLK